LRLRGTANSGREALLNRGRRGRLIGGEHIERLFLGRLACGLSAEDLLTARAAEILAAQRNGEGVNDAAVGATNLSEHPSNPPEEDEVIGGRSRGCTGPLQRLFGEPPERVKEPGLQLQDDSLAVLAADPLEVSTAKQVRFSDRVST
jgi:hypothetical protein